MNKLKKIFIISIIIYTICATFLTSFAENCTNPDGKGTVSITANSDKKTWGTVKNPYQLVMGESLIDIYYGDYAEAIKNGIHFEFVTGKYDAANYIVENNVDKGRLRFKIQGTGPDYLKVTSEQGVNYFQAGGICYLPDYLEDDDKKIENNLEQESKMEVQIPYYSITAIESANTSYVKTVKAKQTSNRPVPDSVTTAQKELVHEVNLGNGYLITDDTMLTNLSTYGTSYVFSKSNIDVNEAYKLSDVQVSKFDGISLNYVGVGMGMFTDANNLTTIEIKGKSYDSTRDPDEVTETYTFNDNLKVVYRFDGTNSEINDSEGEEVSAIEKLISKIGMSIIDVFVDISKIGGGEDGKNYVTIDSLVFNEYENTIVDFWGDTNYLSGKSKEMINFWFNVFKVWAIILYIILLVYIGIKTMLYTGTAEQKKVKGMIEGWLIGVLMLICLPFLFKYLIIINDTIVDILRTNSKYSVYAYYTFEDMYKRWGYEKGEDSATDVVEKLRDALAQLTVDIETIDSNINSNEQKIAELQQEIENNEEMMVQKGKEINEIINKFNRGLGSMVNKRTNKITSIEDVSAGLERELDGHAVKNLDMDTIISNYAANFTYRTIGGIGFGSDDDVQAQLLIKAMGEVYKEKYKLAEEIKEKNLEIERLEEEKEEVQQDKEDVEYAIQKAENNQADLMGEMRTRVGETGRFLYVVILGILIFEVIVLLILYYKRLFMLAILITIFPLVTVAYVFEKTRGEKAKILQTWMQEYTTNVFIQTIHAILYVTLVEVGYSVYIDNKFSLYSHHYSRQSWPKVKQK